MKNSLVKICFYLIFFHSTILFYGTRVFFVISGNYSHPLTVPIPYEQFLICLPGTKGNHQCPPPQPCSPPPAPPSQPACNTRLNYARVRSALPERMAT